MGIYKIRRDIGAHDIKAHEVRREKERERLCRFGSFRRLRLFIFNAARLTFLPCVAREKIYKRRFIFILLALLRARRCV